MSLKTTIATLIVLGLAHQLGALSLDHHRNNLTTVSGFNYTLGFTGLSLNATKGTFNGFDTMRNTSAWRPLVGHNFKAISQNVTLPKLSVFYGQINGSVGPANATGQLLAKLGNAPFNLTLNATSVNRFRCHLQVQMQPINMTAENIHVETKGLGAVGNIFQGINAVWSNFTNTLASNLTAVLPNKLAFSVERELSRKTNLNTICKQLLASSHAKFPEPKF